MTFRHRAGVSAYTATCVLACTCVFGKQSLPPGLCHPPTPRGRAGPDDGGSPLCRRHGSGLPSSLTRIRSLASVYSTRPPVSVWGTSGPGPRAEAFLGRRDHRISGRKGPHHHASPHAAPGFAWGRGRTLDQGKPPPRPATRPRHSMRSTPDKPPGTSQSDPFPERKGTSWRNRVFRKGPLIGRGTGTGISTRSSIRLRLSASP